ncbi:MAG: Zn-dependent hydrolase, partial [Pseudomonadota bacterium]
ARLIIPMHIFSPSSLERFLTGLSAQYEVEISDADHVVLSAATLPSQPTIRVLTPAARDSYLGWDD